MTSIAICRLLIFCSISMSLYLTLTVWIDYGSVKSLAELLDEQPCSSLNGRCDEGLTSNRDRPVVSVTWNGTTLRHDKAGVSRVSMCSFQERTNLVFIKCMKCATESLATVIRRFGYFRNLSFVTPVNNKLYLGWPFPMNGHDYRPSSRGYNILMEHSIYNRNTMRSLMPNDTIYISMIRKPFNQVKSMMNYFQVFKIVNITVKNPLREYFNNLERYEDIYKNPKQHDVRFCIPDGFSMTKNLQSHCLGMPLGFPHGNEDISGDPAAIARYIAQLDSDFDLIMLVEFFFESLVLLRRKMCWTHYDIIFKNLNVKDYPFKGDIADLNDVENIYKQWSAADFELYHHFNKTFWGKIEIEGPDFFQEVESFKNLQENVSKFCDYGVPDKFHANATQWSNGFSMTRHACRNLWPDLLARIQARHDVEEKDLLSNTNMGHDQQALC